MTDPANDPANDPGAFFRDVAAACSRCFWLDGGGAREWSGRRSMVGWLGEDDVSITYDAAAREVRRHAGGRTEVVGEDVFAVLEAELAAGAPDDHWVGYLGYACRPDLPASTGSGLPDAVWMRPAGVRFFDHGSDAPVSGGGGGAAPRPPPPPARGGAPPGGAGGGPPPPPPPKLLRPTARPSAGSRSSCGRATPTR